jgi:uncharacterized coiled-coil protein SlyX
MRWSEVTPAAVKCALPAIALCFATFACAQQLEPVAQPVDLATSIHELQQQIQELRSAVTELRAEAAQYRAETVQLRHELQATQTQNLAVHTAQGESGGARYTSQETKAVQENVQLADQQRSRASLEEQLQLLTSKVDDQYQTKVESGSKYRVRLSGLLLINLFGNRGSVDNTDFPHLATLPVNGTQHDVSGSLRQSLLGLEVFGPEWAGAKTRGELQFDFAGELPRTPNGVNMGMVRLRTGTVHLDWANTSVVAGQDGLFFAPLAPTSLASVAEPALAYSGNLWNWTPQIRIEHRVTLAENSGLLLQAGLMDGVTGQIPAIEYFRIPQAGEAGNSPAIGARVAWTGRAFGQPLILGAGGYYNRQDWGFSRTVDGWAGTADWTVPLGRWFDLSGEFYRGRAVGGLGGALGRSTLWNGTFNDPATFIRGLDSMGGWSQLKFKPWSNLEFNAAVGQDSSFANELRQFVVTSGYYDPALSRNRGGFLNFIYRPRSDLLFSMEFQRMDTQSLYRDITANHLNLSVGVLF